MATEVYIPKFGQTVEEVTIQNWLVEDGEIVKKGQELLEVETDKAVFSVEATDHGYVHKGPYQIGDIVPILTVIAIIGKKNEKFSIKQTEIKEDEIQPNAIIKSDVSEMKKISEIPDADRRKKVFISPRAKKIALEKGVDINKIAKKFSGDKRITEQDVMEYIERYNAISSAEGNYKLFSGIRKVIAERMLMSVQSKANVTLFMDANASKMVQLRKEIEMKKNFKPSYNAILVKIAGIALKKYPYMNVIEKNGQIKLLKEIDINLAVDTDEGLLAPIIRNANEKDLCTIHNEIEDLVRKIKSKLIPPEILGPGSFTITNLGMFDVQAFTPIINPPQIAILGVGKINKKIDFNDGQIQPFDCMPLSLTFDHRVVDGAPAAKFLQYIKDLIENCNKKTF